MSNKKILNVKLSSNQVLPISIFVLCFLVFSIFSQSFLNLYNIKSVLEFITFVALPALGLATIMLTGYFDLSFVGVIGLVSVLTIDLVNKGIHPVIVLFITLVVAVLLEAINGFMIIRFKIHPWLCTIATMLIYLGLEKAVSKGDYISPEGEFFNKVRFSSILGLPAVVWIMIFTCIIMILIMARTPLGTYLYATGGNQQAAKKVGINVEKYCVISYGIAGVLCWISAFCYVSQLSGYPPEAAYINQLEVILAVFFGMALSRKGIINIWGAFLGAAYVGFLANGLGLMGVSSYWIKLFEGLLVVFVILGTSARNGSLVQLD